MERLVEYTDTDSPDIDLPTDFIELANLFVDDVELEQVDMRRFLKTSREGTKPLVFVKIRGQYKLRQEPAADTIVSLHYYGSEDKMVSEEDENSWDKAAEDAVVYGAAELAAEARKRDGVGKGGTVSVESG